MGLPFLGRVGYIVTDPLSLGPRNPLASGWARLIHSVCSHIWRLILQHPAIGKEIYIARKQILIYLFVVVWAAIFAGSFFLSAGIDGPRNIDTGFKRLDMLVKYQLVALALAVASAFAGFVWRKDGKRILIFGLVPLLGTVLLISGIVVFSMFLNYRTVQPETNLPKTPTAPVADLPSSAQE